MTGGLEYKQIYNSYHYNMIYLIKNELTQVTDYSLVNIECWYKLQMQLRIETCGVKK